MAFRDIVGHRRQIGLLARALAADALPPSLVFSGPDGIGKRLAAVAVAQALNCLAPLTDGALGRRDGCGTCVSCSKIVRRIHPDILWIAPEDGEAIKVDAIRHVIGQVTYRPFEGRYRVVIIDQAEQMGDAGQNALLKTLEEPPQRTVVILVTSQPDALLATIRSRCCRIRFAALAPSEIARAMVERHGVPEGDANAAAALAGGSFRRALDAGSGETTDARAVAVAVLHEVAQQRDPRARLAVALTLLQGAARKGQKSAGASERGALAVRLHALASVIRDMTVLSAHASDEALINFDIKSDLAALMTWFDRARLERAFAIVGRSLAAVERHNASPKIVADWLAIQL
ncbi:MAG: DNA polymerase III subunit delta' [Acidobacteriota bacterium]